MSYIVANETYSLGIMERGAASNYILSPESQPEKTDVYGRFIKNMDYSSSKNISIIIHNFAKMFFSENSTTNSMNSTRNQQDDENAPKLLNHNTSNKFDVANSEFILILLTVIYVIIFITGVLGNVVTCIVIARNKGMHTAVNYYLFSLAVSDLLLLISGKFKKSGFKFNTDSKDISKGWIDIFLKTCVHLKAFFVVLLLYCLKEMKNKLIKLQRQQHKPLFLKIVISFEVL